MRVEKIGKIPPLLSTPEKPKEILPSSELNDLTSQITEITDELASLLDEETLTPKEEQRMAELRKELTSLGVTNTIERIV